MVLVAQTTTARERVDYCMQEFSLTTVLMMSNKHWIKYLSVHNLNRRWHGIYSSQSVNPLSPKQNGCHFADCWFSEFKRKVYDKNNNTKFFLSQWAPNKYYCTKVYLAMRKIITIQWVSHEGRNYPTSYWVTDPDIKYWCIHAQIMAGGCQFYSLNL